jgi:hypothetical protein
MILAFGELWNPDTINWGSPGAGNAGQLLGKYNFARAGQSPPRIQTVDFWNETGVYVLLNEFKAVYVGKADKTVLGIRLRNHLSDRFAGRWDMFSWYGLRKPRQSDLGLSVAGQRTLNSQQWCNLLESILIRVTDPPLNRQVPTLPFAKPATQNVGRPRTIRSYLQQLVNGEEDNEA